MPATVTADGLRVAIRVVTRAGRNAIGDIERDAAGVARLRVRVTAVPEGGKANKAVIKLLAKAWRIPRSSITLAAGAKDRNKVLHIAGDGRALKAGMDAWRGRR